MNMFFAFCRYHLLVLLVGAEVSHALRHPFKNLRTGTCAPKTKNGRHDSPSGGCNSFALDVISHLKLMCTEIECCNLSRNSFLPRVSNTQTVSTIFLPAPLQKLVGDFFCFGEGNFVGNLAGILRDFFGPTKERIKQFREFRSIFREKIRSPQKIFHAKIRSADVPP